MDATSIPPNVLLAVAVLALAVAVVQAVASLLARWARRHRASVRMARAVAGEERAPALLVDRGFEVIGAQVVVEHAVRIDERVVAVPLRADYLATRDGARYVVEVKTGAHAPRIETSATRRQILEYRVAFDVDGVVLVDAEAGSVHEITFPALDRFAVPARSERSRGWPIVALAVAAVAAVAVAALRFG